MKKIIALFVTLAMVFTATVALATTYENSAFIGSWIARGTDGSINARLYVDYCDSERIKCRFETYKNGETQRYYEIYQAPIDDTKAKSTFSTIDSFNTWYPTGNCEIELTADRIKFTIDSSDNVRIYSGIFSPESTEFNSQVSPYNTNVNILVNNEPVQTELSPFILKSRTFVPLRGVFEAMGINVEWADTTDGQVHTHEIKATRGDYTVSITRENKNSKGFGSWSLTKKVGETTTTIDLSDVQPVIINDSTFVPLRVIVESFDTFIDWNNDTRCVLIVDENAAQKPSEQAPEVEQENAPAQETTEQTTEQTTQETQTEQTTEQTTTEDTKTPDDEASTEETPVSDETETTDENSDDEETSAENAMTEENTTSEETDDNTETTNEETDAAEENIASDEETSSDDEK